jgi:hypothetical protein
VTNSTHLADWISYPFALLVKSAKCIDPTRDPSRATAASLVVSHPLPKLKVLFGVGIIKGPNKSGDDGDQKVVPRSGLIAILFKFLQSG